MTETEARQVLLLQAHEQDPASTTWSAQDRAWATRQAVAAVGDSAAPAVFVVARAAAGLQRLLPRDAGARRWLERRAWHGAWVWLAAFAGLVLGLLADQLGPPQHVNLLAPAVWAVVAWNLLVYISALLPWRLGGLQQALARWGLGGRGDASAALLWARHAGPMSLARAALVLHVAAALLAVGLMLGLYLRGLVLDYRAGWQSTFLNTPQVQAILGTLLAPASAVTGIALPDVAPLRVGPGAPATASAAPWIHLYATTLLLWVVLPRTLLALWAGLRARGMARRFRLPLDTPYFESLHPLMRPGLSRTLRLLWAAPPTLGPVTLLGQRITAALPPLQPLTLLRTDDGEELQLLPAPSATQLERGSALALSGSSGGVTSWWQRKPAEDTSAPTPASLRAQTDAVLWVAPPGAPYPAWLAALQRPVLVLHDAAVAEPPALPLRSLAAGWLPDGRWLQLLQAALPDDGRVQRITEVWTQRQHALFDADVDELAASLGRVAAARVPLANDGLLARRGAADAAQQALADALQVEWRDSAARMAALPGRTPGGRGGAAARAQGDMLAGQAMDSTGASTAQTLMPWNADAAIDGHAQEAGDTRPNAADTANADAAYQTLPNAAALRTRVGEGSAAVVGGVTTGALAGLKADVLSGGLTMGAGLVVGALLGAVTAAGLARGVNVVRGTDRSFAAWDTPALGLLTEAWLLRYLSPGRQPEATRVALQAALAAHKDDWGAVWKHRSQRFDSAGEAQRLADALRAPLAAVLRDALARLHPAGPAPTLPQPPAGVAQRW